MSWAQKAPQSGYSPATAAVVTEGLAQHKSTTSSSANAARIALETRDTAQASLSALEKQGDQLERVNADLDVVNADQKEAQSSLRSLRWMRRCCCCLTVFSCCGDCDPNSARDDTRKLRVSRRKQVRFADAASRSQETEMVGGQGARIESQTQAAQEQRRKELFNGQERPPMPAIVGGPRGDGLQEEDAEAVRQGTAEQDANIRVVQGAAQDIKRLAYAIEGEVSRQMPLVDATVDRVGDTRAKVRESARQTFNYRTGR